MLANISSRKKHILVYGRYVSHLKLLYPLFLNSEYHFVVYSDLISVADFEQSQAYELTNVSFVSDVRLIAPKLSCIGALVTTDCLAARAHIPALILVNLCKKSGIPIVEYQHGLFTYGMSYYVRSATKQVQEDSLPCCSYADYILSFYPQDDDRYRCMGYPLYTEKVISRYEGEYTLVLTNMHWGVYSYIEKFTLYRSVFEVAQKMSNELFVWKMHPAEINNGICKSICADLFSMYPSVRKNLVFAHEDRLLNFSDALTLIAKSKRCITTLSTTILDCELAKKPTIIYNSETTRSMIEKIKSADIFSHPEELIERLSHCGVIESGLLYKYDNKVCEKFFNEVYHEPDDKFTVLENFFQIYCIALSPVHNVSASVGTAHQDSLAISDKKNKIKRIKRKYRILDCLTLGLFHRYFKNKKISKIAKTSI